MKDVSLKNCSKSCRFLVLILFGSKNELHLPCGKFFYDLRKLLGFSNRFLTQYFHFHTVFAWDILNNPKAAFLLGLVDDQYKIIHFQIVCFRCGDPAKPLKRSINYGAIKKFQKCFEIAIHVRQDLVQTLRRKARQVRDLTET